MICFDALQLAKELLLVDLLSFIHQINIVNVYFLLSHGEVIVYGLKLSVDALLLVLNQIF